MPNFFLGTPRVVAALQGELGLINDAVVIELPEGLDEGPTFPSFESAWMCFGRVAGALDAISPSALRDSIAAILIPVSLPNGVPAGDTQEDGAWDALRAYDRDRDPIHSIRIEALLAWLILSFPEVRWTFWSGGPHKRTGGGAANPLAEWHGLTVGRLPWEGKELHALAVGSQPIDGDAVAWDMPCILDFPALFDPSGLRATLRGLLGIAAGAPLAPARPSRRELALAVDEEADYCVLEAFSAYRFGYRVLATSTWKAFDAVWNWKSSREKPCLSFEDMYLNFPDQPDRLPQRPSARAPHLSDLEYRDSEAVSGINLFPATERRVFVTVGHHKGATGRSIWAENKRYLRVRGVHWKHVSKPIGSIFRIAEEADLWRSSGKCARYPSSFDWPPSSGELRNDEPTGHSAPGRLLAFSQRLIRRARALLKECDNVQDAIHAATLALEAKELLADQTPTTALEAVALQHQAEIVAESLFAGIEYNLDLGPRFNEIAIEVKRVSKWFHGNRKTHSELNARLAIAEQLARRFSDLNQIEEEAACLETATRLRFDLWARSKPWRLPLWPVLRYLSYVLPSLPRLALAVLAWILFFGWIYFLRGTPHPGHSLPYQLFDSVTASAHFFATLQLPDDWSPSLSGAGGQLILVAQGFIALTNLGMLTSNFFSIISRR